MKNKQNDEFEILRIFSKRDNRGKLKKMANIQFKGYNQILTRRYSDCIEGAVKNPFKKSVYNIGYYGYCNPFDVPIKNKDYRNLYDKWKDMIRRCYIKDGTLYYQNVGISPEFLSFKNFYDWSMNRSISNYRFGFYLDKDIIGNSKVYSSDTCVYVPKHINNLFVNIDNSYGYTISKGKWIVSITHKRTALGRYDNSDEATRVYKLAKMFYIVSVCILSYSFNEINDRCIIAVLHKYYKDISNDDIVFIKDRPLLYRFILSCVKRLSKAIDNNPHDVIINKVQWVI